MLEKQEFEVLRFLCESHGNITQRLIAEETKLSLGAVNKIVARLKQAEYITENYNVTENGINVMEPYKVKNAIILAAGMSSRFIPVSYEIPKGLISVKGDIMIERIIEQLKAAGIQEIVVVIGYKMEKFFYLRNKYDVKLVVNNEFASKNTHSSVYVARDYLSNTYICCSDNYYPKNMFHRYEYRAFYCSVYIPGISYVERAFQFDNNGLIYDTNKPSNNQWVMYGHAYFDINFTNKFKPILEDYFGRPGIEYMYWETIYAENVNELPMWIRQCDNTEILEFDSMEELKQFDRNYIYNNKVKVFENICNVLHCDISDIEDIETIKKGLNNQSFKFICKGDSYIYRHPGANASTVIDRHKEALSLKAAKELNVDDSFICIDENEGWKISKFISTTDTFDFHNIKHIELLAKKLKALHSSAVSVGFGFNYQKEAEKIIDIEKNFDTIKYNKSLLEKNSMQPIFDYLSKDKWQVSLCHNDIYEPNLLVSGDNLCLIDWEFAGDADIGFDICKLFSVINPPYDEIDKWVYPYFNRQITDDEKLHLISCAAVIYYYWFVWGGFAEKNNEGVSAYLLDWYDKMNGYREMALKLLNQKTCKEEL
ncbi:MAG: NTP transferase domain-containing protein [Acutalibacteraceae bacterium]|nr:NTP transferase domain-containing protein [Acutalibacteraceae bacterium]